MTFHRPVLPLYLMLSVPTQLVLGALLGGVAGWKYHSTGRSPTPDDLLFYGLALIGSGLLLVPTAFGMAHWSRVRVGPSGVEVPGTWGLRRSIAWNAVESVEPVRYLGLLHLRLRTITGRPAWLPVRVNRVEEYREVIARCAGEEHPVTRALRSTH